MQATALAAAWGEVSSIRLVSPGPRSDQGEEGLESSSVAVAGIEQDSGGKQNCSLQVLQAFSRALCCPNLAFSSLSCSVSFLICKILFLIRSLSFHVRKIYLSICSISLLVC